MPQPFTDNGDVSIWVKTSQVGKKTNKKTKILSLSEPYSGVKQKIFKEIHHFYPQLPPLESHEMYIFCLPTIQRLRLAQ